MERPPGLVNNYVAQCDSRSKEIPREQSLSAKQESDIYYGKRKQSLRARYVYGFIFLATNLFAWFIRDYGHKILASFHRIVAFCGIKGDDCFHAGGVLRVSFGSSIYFLFMFVTTFRASKLHGARNSWHSSWWILKFVLYLAAMMISFIMPAYFIQLYGEVARIGAGIFLLLQLISVIHFISWCDSHWKPDLQSKQNGFWGLLLSAILYTATFSGIVLMYFKYAPDTSCTLNIFVITWTVILVNVMMIVSLHSKINRGLLSSALMGLYTVFLCWSAIQSEPPIEKCNMQKEMDDNIDMTTILSFLIGICVIVMATFSTGIDSKAFQFSKDEVQLKMTSLISMMCSISYFHWEQCILQCYSLAGKCTTQPENGALMSVGPVPG
ncbi:putative serine incorporator isoform X1 [Iris pallida]|uniref:Serine incorporator isoform X1 n=1 Tax=Iris pallida TaxID=29817 RepID=A0AAX6HRD1_IRIPA|nr:putative serine incorporator isoform X1 [Iris pallida]